MAEDVGEMPRDWQEFMVSIMILWMAYYYYGVRQNFSGSTSTPLTNAAGFYAAVWPNIHV